MLRSTSIRIPRHDEFDDVLIHHGPRPSDYIESPQYSETTSTTSLFNSPWTIEEVEPQVSRTNLGMNTTDINPKTLHIDAEQ